MKHAICIAALALASCATPREVVSSARVGGGFIDATDGQKGLYTVSVAPFADHDPDPTASPQQVEFLHGQRAELREELRLMAGKCATAEESAAYWRTLADAHAAQAVGHECPTALLWWKDAEFLAWLSGLVALLLGCIFRKQLGAAARKMGVGGDPA